MPEGGEWRGVNQEGSTPRADCTCHCKRGLYLTAHSVYTKLSMLSFQFTPVTQEPISISTRFDQTYLVTSKEEMSYWETHHGGRYPGLGPRNKHLTPERWNELLVKQTSFDS